MNKLSGPTPFRLGLLVFASVVVTAAAFAGAQERAGLHGPLTRLEFVAAKSLSGEGSGAKSGELGDAAVTSDRYDVLRYGLDLRIDPADQTIAGSVKMVFASTYPGLRRFVFDLRSTLTVAGVEHRQGALPFTHAADSVEVVLPFDLPVGAVDSVVVTYGGQPANPIYNRGLMFKTHTRLPGGDFEDTSPIVANMSQPAYAQSWWPCKDKPGDKFLVSMDLTVPDTLTGVSNGTLVGVVDSAPGWRTFSWSEAYPIAAYLVSVAISDYFLLSEDCVTRGGSVVPLRNWVFLSDLEDARVDFEPLCDMMDFCERHFGPYPFLGEKYGHAEFIWPGAMEHQTVTSIGAGALQGDGSREWLLVHELGHQWFGDSLTPAEWADIWLNEGFSTYSEALWYEDSQGLDAYHAFIADKRNEREWLAEGPVYDPVPVLPGRVIYDKGAWILHMLRGRMGDGPFFALLRAWAGGSERVRGFVETQEFIDLASSYAAEDLDDFLWPYLETVELPELAVSYDIQEGDAGPGTRVTVLLRQTQPTLFDNVYPLRITTAAGTTETVFPLSGRSSTQVFELDSPVVDIELDPESWVLWNMATTEEFSAGLSRVYPNPSLGGYVVFRYRLTQRSHVVLRVMDAMGRQVDRVDLGWVEPELEFNEFGWDVATRSNARVPSGVYWAALEIDGHRSVRKFAVVR
jgi:aminopeptidase N